MSSVVIWELLEMYQEPTNQSSIYLGHVTGYQPIRDQYFLKFNFGKEAFCAGELFAFVLDTLIVWISLSYC